MRAILKPLSGKYYGTEVEIHFDDGHEKEVVKFWNSGDFEPSVRQLEAYGYTQEEWDNDEEVDDGWGGKIRIKDMGLICDSHYESRLTYERALNLINLIESSLLLKKLDKGMIQKTDTQQDQEIHLSMKVEVGELRDHFAGLAMQSYTQVWNRDISPSHRELMLDDMVRRYGRGTTVNKAIALMSYEMADNMLSARSNNKTSE